MSERDERRTRGSDHDSVVTLITAVANLDQKFSEKFAELKADIKDIKEGSTARICSLENRVEELEKSKLIYYTTTIIYAGIGATMIGLIFWHVFQK